MSNVFGLKHEHIGTNEYIIVLHETKNKYILFIVFQFMFQIFPFNLFEIFLHPWRHYQSSECWVTRQNFITLHNHLFVGRIHPFVAIRVCMT